MTREELTKLAGEPCIYAGHGDIGLRDVPECAASGMRPHGWCAPCVYRAAVVQAEAGPSYLRVCESCGTRATLHLCRCRAEEYDQMCNRLRQAEAQCAANYRSWETVSEERRQAEAERDEALSIRDLCIRAMVKLTGETEDSVREAPYAVASRFDRDRTLVNAHAMRDKLLVSQDCCPECGGDLDTGWECNQCGYDAKMLR